MTRGIFGGVVVDGDGGGGVQGEASQLGSAGAEQWLRIGGERRGEVSPEMVVHGGESDWRI